MKKKMILWGLSLIGLAQLAIADTGDGMMGYGMKGGYGMMGAGGWFGWGLLWLVYFAIASLIFSLIFWYTYKLMIKEKKKRR